MTKINNQNIGYDGNGNIRSDGQHSYTYDARNRMSGVDGNTFFTYNAVDQRVKKSGSNGTTLYAWANDRIIGEYTSGGQAKNETIYLGSTPVGIIKSGTRYRVYADQTDTPRLITTQGNTTVWRWKSKPFGESQPNEDVDGNGNNFVYNLRFPGQYYDAETKTHYNYRRDYNPTTGRYIQSDPIGISGGIGTYSYVGSSPLLGRDPRGEFSFAGFATAPSIFEAAASSLAAVVSPVLVTSAAAFAAIVTPTTLGDGTLSDNVIVGDFGGGSNGGDSPDDGDGGWCKLEQSKLLGRQLNLINLRSILDDIQYGNAAREYNTDASIHNIDCPEHQVALLPLS